MAQPVLNIVSEDIEKPHVPENVEKSSVQEHVRARTWRLGKGAIAELGYIALKALDQNIARGQCHRGRRPLSDEALERAAIKTQGCSVR